MKPGPKCSGSIVHSGASRAISDSAHSLDVSAPRTNSGCRPCAYPKRAMNKASANEHPEKRGNRRARMARPARVRPSDPRDEHFEDLPVSANVSKDGIYFTTQRNSYYKGMGVFVTFPYSSPHEPMNCEYVAEVGR